ncbi:T9SS type A sorting domain-containing protein [Aequorivita sp. Q41]|uniref:T9SS type A sorting domain-containing protein n=1 Tax=Aequorivita sp. Q41 TaxID=3153300 RepID=UPI003242B20A
MILIFVGFSIYSQDYKPLLDNLNEWHYTSCYSGCLTDVYYTDGDTIVAGKNYKILDGFHFISRSFLLREDVANKKVYLNFISAGSSEEFLLYDFSLNEGDTFNMLNPVSPFPSDGGPFILDAIFEETLADGNDYRHFYFSPAPGNTVSTENAVWVEGAGSLSLINAPGGHPNINKAGHLSCFFKNTELFYTNLDSISNCIPVHLEVEKYNLTNVTLTKAINQAVCVLNNTKNIKNISVYDVSGKKLNSINNVAENSLNVDLSSYKNGLYILLVTAVNSSRKSFKVIK